MANSGVLPQEADGPNQLSGEMVDFRLRGREGQTGPGRATEAVMAMQRLCAMVAAADADPRRIQQGSEVVRMEPLHRKGRQGAAIGL